MLRCYPNITIGIGQIHLRNTLGGLKMSIISDPVRLEVLKNTFEGIGDGMAITLVRTSRSSVVRTGHDFSTAILTPTAELVGQGMCSPIHLGGMGVALESCFDN